MYGLFACALWRSGELILTQTVVQRTLNKDDTGAGQVRLFGLAYREESRPYKQKMTAETAADVLVLGTSRSMQFRGAFFETDSFYNAGGALPFLPQALNFLGSLPEKSLPEHLLLVLDQYFYNETWATRDDARDTGAYLFETKLRPFTALRRVMAATADGKCNVFQMLQTPPDVVGVAASARGAGFYADGSYSYGTAVLHPEKSADAGFRDTLSRIAQNTNRFEYGDTVSAYNLAVTEQLLQFCAAHGISVTAVIPPYAPTVWHTMQSSGNYTYIEKLLPTLQPMFAKYGYEVFDYTDLSAATTDAMYIDGFHGSDRVYAYICARLADDSAQMGQYFDREKLMALFEAPGNPLCVNLPDA
ncbi:MAG: hypothetical protein RRZ93_04320 [Ruthenibacterium sp.]